MDDSRYEHLLRHAKRAYLRYRTKEVSAKQAALDATVVERDLTREERKALRDRLVKDILPKS